jgi:DNA-binding SARP family transcriptional activator
MRVQLQLLGRFQVAVEERAIPADAWRRERGAALVKLLALAPGHRVHREQVMEHFWPKLDPEAAGANLRKAVLFARRSLGVHELVELDGEVVAFAPAAELDIDVDAFEAAAQAALRSDSPAACAEAAERYGGELLPDDRYVEWLEAPREKLRERYARLLRAGRLWERLVELDPTDEEAQGALMQAALEAGNRGEVIRLFNALRERLRLDLGVGPRPSTLAIYERAFATPEVAPQSPVDRIRAALAWGLVHLQSGDFGAAERVAKETRQLALGAALAREAGEASALLGMVAHMQGRWLDLFHAEFTEWVRAAPAFVSNIFDGHLCLAEFCLAGAAGHAVVGRAARELLAVAEAAGSRAGRALATLLLGEAELFSGRLDEAERLLEESERLHDEVGASAGRVIALERLAGIALVRGQKWRASRLVERGSKLAVSTWLNPHLFIRLQGLAVQAASTPEQAEDAIRDGDRALASGRTCQPCSMGFRAAAAIALAEAGELDELAGRLDEAERLAGMWHGGPWEAALWEARGVQRRAQGREERAHSAFSEAAARFAELGRPLDEARCLARRSGPAA